MEFNDFSHVNVEKSTLGIDLLISRSSAIIFKLENPKTHLDNYSIRKKRTIIKKNTVV